MNSGICVGGPLDSLPLHHSETTMLIPIEAHSRRVRVGVQPGAAGYEFGEYRFTAGLWQWSAPWLRPAAKIV